jgi:8-oxo-dGTP diphosphatase
VFDKLNLYVEILRHVSILFKRTLITVEVIIQRKDGSIVLVKRAFDPFKGYWALPGGFLRFGKTIEETAIQEAKEETGLDIEIERLVNVSSDPQRDPRGHVISITLATKEVAGELRAGSDAIDITTTKAMPQNLAFDHLTVLRKSGLLDD